MWTDLVVLYGFALDFMRKPFMIVKGVYELSFCGSVDLVFYCVAQEIDIHLDSKKHQFTLYSRFFIILSNIYLLHFVMLSHGGSVT